MVSPWFCKNLPRAAMAFMVSLPIFQWAAMASVMALPGSATAADLARISSSLLAGAYRRPGPRQTEALGDFVERRLERAIFRARRGSHQHVSAAAVIGRNHCQEGILPFRIRPGERQESARAAVDGSGAAVDHGQIPMLPADVAGDPVQRRIPVRSRIHHENRERIAVGELHAILPKRGLFPAGGAVDAKPSSGIAVGCLGEERRNGEACRQQACEKDSHKDLIGQGPPGVNAAQDAWPPSTAERAFLMVAGKSPGARSGASPSRWNQVGAESRLKGVRQGLSPAYPRLVEPR